MSTFKFSPGDRVRLTALAVRYYGGNAQWCPEGQGGGTGGTVISASDRPHDYAADARPYMVRWDNGVTNSYREADLIEAQDEGDVLEFGNSVSCDNIRAWRNGE